MTMFTTVPAHNQNGQTEVRYGSKAQLRLNVTCG